MWPYKWTWEIDGTTLSVSSYTIAVTTALALFAVGGYLRLRRERSPRMAQLLVVSLVGTGLIGSKLGAVVLSQEFDSSAHLFSGLSLDGALIAATITLGIFASCERRSCLELAALLLPLGMVAIFVCRIGCFMNGCCHGLETELPWGVTFPLGSRVHLEQLARQPHTVLLGVQAVHPTQLYEGILALLLAWLSRWFCRRQVPSFVYVPMIMSFLFAGRMVNDVLRAPFNTAQPQTSIVHGALLLSCLVVLSLVGVRMLAGNSHPLSRFGKWLGKTRNRRFIRAAQGVPDGSDSRIDRPAGQRI